MKQASLFDDHQPPEKDAHRQSPSPHTLKELAFDVETTGNNPMSDSVVGIALCRREGEAYYVPVRHADGPNLPDAPEILSSIFEDETVAKIGHNLKFDIFMMRREGIEVRGPLFDTMVASYLLNPNWPNHSLEEVGLEYLHHRKRPFREVLGKKASFAEVPLEKAAPYAAEDAELAFELRQILFPKLDAEGLAQLYHEIEMPLIRVLADMETAGVKIDIPLLTALSKELERDLVNLQTTIYRTAGQEFNINSPRQLAKVLFEDLGLKPGRKTKTGFSTSVDVLEDLAHQHELPGHILNYRTLHKLKTTYIDTLPALAEPSSKRIHTSFNQTITATGRLSSSDPNLQNIPVRTEWGTRIRSAFIADSGSLLLSADYSQIELRILAHMSGDAGLTHAFQHNIDVHARTASEVFQKPVDAVSADERRFAKTINFGVIYGMSAFGLSEALDIAPKDAAEFIQHYFATHSGVKSYIEETLETARRQGYVSTLFGRKRQIPDVRSTNV
ncbi:MAG TPA: DNA polymerase, partial [Dissulfurispiraceae bacterium]|nr:DNA polymerase [Dissulfurispiraceae bacterium]